MLPCRSNWDFEVLRFEPYQLVEEACSIINEYGLLQNLNIPKKQLTRLVQSIYLTSCAYEIPYHNMYHFVDVLQVVHFVLGGPKGEVRCIFTPLETFSLLMAALSHDLGHPGLTNSYLINTHSTIAKYDTVAPLEAYHAVEAEKLLLHPHRGLKDCIGEATAAKVVYLMKEFIMATDLSKNASFIDNWRNTLPIFDQEQESHRILLGQMIIKFADIANPCRPFNSAKKWAKRIQEEFHLQGDREAHLGLQVSPFMDRQPDWEKQLAELQTTFVTKIVCPVVDALREKLPFLTEPCTHLVNNLIEWNKILQ